MLDLCKMLGTTGASLLLIFVSSALALSSQDTNHECSKKWLSGYRISSAQPQKTLLNLSLKECEEECLLSGCAAFAYGALPPYNKTCELAINTRASRSAGGAGGNATLGLVDKSPPWDVYLISKTGNCGKRSYLFGNRESPMMGGAGAGPIPIDCFYRLLSGKRLAKPHSFKSMSVATLAECQDACIREGSFQCRSVSYRYMPSGISYSVSNCELSPFFMVAGQTHQHDFVDDFDYDFFQREPYCKTTGGAAAGQYGVCSVVIRRSGLITLTLAKSSQSVTTPSQCEHLCTTAQFRCLTFAFRHTDRGNRDPFRYPRHASCYLFDTEFGRIPSHNVENDPDFDLYEMGRLMGGECMLTGQYGSRYRPVTSVPPPPMDYYRPPPVPPQSKEVIPWHHHHVGGGSYGQGQGAYGQGQGHYGGVGGVGGAGMLGEPHRKEEHPRLPGDKTNYFDRDRVDSRFPTPSGQGQTHHVVPVVPSHHKEIGGIGHGQYGQGQGGGGHHQGHYGGSTSSSSTGLQDKSRPLEIASTSGQMPEGCLVRMPTARPDTYLVPDVSRATFPTKTLDECRVECLRSSEVLRFPCRVMSFRYTSHSGGTCQLSETPPHSLREADFMSSHHGGNAVVLFYDERISGCRLPDRRVDSDYYGGGVGGGGRGWSQQRDHTNNYYGGGGRYNTGGVGGGVSSYPAASSGSYYDRYGQDRYGDRDRYYGGTTERDRYGSGGGHYGGSSAISSSYGDRDRYYGGQGRDPYAPSSISNYGTGSGGQYGSSYGHGSGGGSNYYGHLHGHGHGYERDTHAQLYTVDGERCMHSCLRNKDAGFYYCQIDRESAWNFCCRPDDGQCGYSRGVSFAWCYVGTGPSRDIWRTCKRQQALTTVQFLHTDEPPLVHTALNGTVPIGNLTINDAVDLLEDKEPGGSTTHHPLEDSKGKNETSKG